MTTKTDITLPPLPGALVDVETEARAYARAAVEADRRDHIGDATGMVPSDEHLIETGCYQTVIERHSQPAASAEPDHETALALADAPRSLRDYVAALRAAPVAQELVAWVAADTLNSSHPTCISSLAYMSQIDRERGREYVPLYTSPVTAQAQPQQSENPEALADTQRAIIEAAERRGYERAIAECVQDLEDAQRWRYIRQFLVLDDVGDEEYCPGLVVMDEWLVEDVTPHVWKLLSEGKRNPTVDDVISAAREAKGE